MVSSLIYNLIDKAQIIHIYFFLKKEMDDTDKIKETTVDIDDNIETENVDSVKIPKISNENDDYIKKSSGISNENDDKVKNHRISKIAVSPNGTYVVTYSKDDKSIFGWSIVNEDPTLEVKNNDGWNINKDEKIKKDPYPLKVKNNVCEMKVSD